MRHFFTMSSLYLAPLPCYFSLAIGYPFFLCCVFSNAEKWSGRQRVYSTAAMLFQQTTSITKTVEKDKRVQTLFLRLCLSSVHLDLLFFISSFLPYLLILLTFLCFSSKNVDCSVASILHFRDSPLHCGCCCDDFHHPHYMSRRYIFPPSFSLICHFSLPTSPLGKRMCIYMTP
ncbi:MAG: hypothetical protein JOS17DRAFT_271259 [Linnemannia elongata]|nr:MAG: hypothetical protein JOS17DRAFT_271259 [Linnemannia elongata]